MKNLKNRVLALALALVMAVGLAAPAMAAGQTFSDVPESYWGYADIEAVAEAGLMNGTGNGAFSPEMKVSVAQFLTLLGRLVFPETTVGANDTWYGPYVAAAQGAGLLAGIQVDTGNVEAEISRYDMAVILRAAGKQLGVAEKSAQQSEVTDFGMIPNMYTEAVLAVYGMGLIRGDQAGNFNGGNTMMRAEVATVIMRLAKAKPGSGAGNPEQPSNATYHLELSGSVVLTNKGVLVVGERTPISCNTAPNAAGLADAPYGQNRSGFSCTSNNPSVVLVERNANDQYWFLTALALGSATVTVTDPYGVSASMDVTVVAEREGIGTETHMVSVRATYEEHTTRGNAYTKTTYVPSVPYKIYFTRDGGKTAQLVYEGVTLADASKDDAVEIELPKDAFYSRDAGLYISAEANVNGQRMVTSDLRTDGRAYISPINSTRTYVWIDGVGHKAYDLTIKLTPPEGEKSRFTFKGYVLAGRWDEQISGATIQLYLKDGTLIGETTSKTDGTFEMECEVDALDGGFNKREEQYRVVAWGYASDGYCGTKSSLRSLVDLKIAPSMDQDGPGSGNYRLLLPPEAQPVTN